MMSIYKATVLSLLSIILLSTIPAYAATVTANYTYDNIGRLTSTSYSNTPNVGSIGYNYDAAGNLTSSTTTGAVAPINHPPVPTAAAIQTTVGLPATTQVSANDPDVADTHTYAVTTVAANGTASIDVNGLATYTPNAGYAGTDSFVVTVTDNGTPQKSGIVTINVTVSATPDTTPPVITLTGGNVNVTQGGVFTEPGYSAIDNPGAINLTGNVVVTGGPVNTNAAVGTVFTLNYNVSDAAGNAAIQKTRTVTITAPVNMVDTTPPVITLIGGSNITISQGSTYTDLGATATDDVDGNITNSVMMTSTVNTSVVGVYTVTYTVSDAAGNAATPVVRTVNVIVNQPPTISLVGATPITIVQGAAYNDRGATAVDDIDGNITNNISVTNTVNTATVGTYSVTYNVSDTARNAATPVTRIVNVVLAGSAANAGETVQVSLPGSTSSVDIYAAGQSVSNFSLAAGTPPTGVQIPFGVLSYTTTVAAGMSSQTVRLSFSNALPANFKVYKVDGLRPYIAIPNGLGVDQWTQIDGSTIEVNLSDGGQFDLDGTVNGSIVDPIAIGIPSSTTPSSPAPQPSSNGNTSGGNTSSGGCLTNVSISVSTIVLMMLLLLGGFLARKRKLMGCV